MQAIKKILNVKNNTLILKDLDALNNKTVEVIIIPVTDEEVKSDKNKLFKFNGAGESQLSDTSKKVDSIIYGR